jgi:Flp pilus assembly pilin Flp
MTAVRRDDRGASSVEYGLLLTAIAAVIVIAVFAVGQLTDSLYKNTCSRIDDKVTITEAC